MSEASSPAVEWPTLDVVAVGAHPDDIEIGCGGVLARLVEQGYRVGMIDMTDGEPTPGSPGPEVRLREAQAAAQMLGVCERIQLNFPNRRLFDGFEVRVALARQFRRFRPRLVLGIGSKTPMASPDHYQAMLITEAAVFYSKLTKWDDLFEGAAPYTIPAMMYYHLAMRTLSPGKPNAIVVDIGTVLEKKIAAIACYQTQFSGAKAQLLQRIRAINIQQGMAAGFDAGEVLVSPHTLGTRDLMGLVLGAGGRRGSGSG